MQRDFRLTEDGDLQLGSPRVNEAGELLYINRFGEENTNADGELIRDFTLAVSMNSTKQVMSNRLRTDAPDWMHHPTMGGNLSDLVGEPNTRETGERGVALIKEALMYEEFISADVLNVRAVPVSPTTILFYIEIKEDNQIELTYPLLFNLEHGILSEYEVK